MKMMERFLSKLGTGLLILMAARSGYSANNPIELVTGTLQVGADGSLGDTKPLVMDAKTTLKAAGVVKLANPITFNGTGTQIDTSSNSFAFNLIGNITSNGAQSLTKIGLGTLTLGGVNTYSGGTVVNNGLLSIGTTPSLPLLSDLTISTLGAVDLSGNSVNIGNLIGAPGSVVTSSTKATTLTISQTATNATFAGSLQKALFVTVNGSGTQTFSGNNSYTGPTTIAQGSTLNIGGTSALSPASNVTVLPAGKLNLLGGYRNAAPSLTSAGDVTNKGVTTFNNFSITGGTFTNTANASLGGNGTNPAIIVTSGTVTNGTSGIADTSTIGDNNTSFTFSGGTINNYNLIKASTYTQSTGYPQLNLFLSKTRPAQGFVQTSGDIHVDGSISVTNQLAVNPRAKDFFPLLFTSGGSVQGVFSDEIISGFNAKPASKIVYANNSVGLLFFNRACDSSWVHSGSEKWDDGDNWDSGCIPGAPADVSVNDIATLPNIPGQSAITIKLTDGSVAVPITLYHLNFSKFQTSPTTSYKIQQFSPESSISFDCDLPASLPQINVLAGSHSINAPIVLKKNTDLYLADGAKLTLNSATKLTSFTNIEDFNVYKSTGSKQGTGTLLVDGASLKPHNMTLTSGTVINKGSIQPSGSLTIRGGSLINEEQQTVGSKNSQVNFVGGTLTTTGQVAASNYKQREGTKLQMNLASTSSFGSINAKQAASLDGALIVEALPTYVATAGDVIDLITAGTKRTGMFSSVELLHFPDSVIPELMYKPQAVELVFSETLGFNAIGSTPQLILSSVNETNQRVGRELFTLHERLLQRGSQAKGTAVAINQTPYYEQQLTASRGRLMSREVGANQQVQEKEEQLSDRVAQNGTSKERPWRVYVGPTSSFGSIDSKKDQAGLGYQSVGFFAGGDYAFQEWGLGFELDYEHISASAHKQAGHSNLDELHGSCYATWIPACLREFALNAIVGAGHDWYKIGRKAGPFQAPVRAVGTPSGNEFDTLAGFEYILSNTRWKAMPKNFQIVPIANIQYIYAHMDSYKEHGGGLYDLKVHKGSLKSLRSYLGSRFNHVARGSRVTFKSELDLGWQREYMNADQTWNVTTVNVPQTKKATSKAIGLGSNTFLLGLDGLLTIHECFQIEASYDYQWNSMQTNNSFYLGLGGTY